MIAAHFESRPAACCWSRPAITTMRSLKASSGSRIGVISQSAPSALGVHSFVQIEDPVRHFHERHADRPLVSTAKAGVMASSMGRARAAPAPAQERPAAEWIS